ncbi:hypothetical protein AMQ84_11140 [Paenibacillus riograndensis]|uniref:Uncharacterized protein n=1 Tax=Paenibacillus riograndensis TaxID=483937 RepID=A0A132U2W4_9BACL|nr:hypothetical protein [Paenibacillus riograndensis]KWX77793.1 hypothetical protein AMQ84_11140 [Paenibacillus riograndensis]KWX85951.1 hypothetical protein AMQ83_21730 [Paenibacillus riograndensis]
MDAKAKKILNKTFWSAQGWKPAGTRLPFAGEEFEYAKSKGVMFDPVTMTHDECVSRIRYLLEHEVTKDRVAAAFLHSLSTRKVHLRSGLSSYALTSNLPQHKYSDKLLERASYSHCFYCNDHKLMTHDEWNNADINILNFERVKWGGVRLNWLLYCWMDIELLAKEEPVEVTSEDVQILKNLLAEVDACAETDSARKLEKRWKDVLSSNQYERDVMMEIWGYAGILASEERLGPERGRGTDFVSVDTWLGIDRYAKEKVEYYFGTYL